VVVVVVVVVAAAANVEDISENINALYSLYS
jgi:hypothetical protein